MSHSLDDEDRPVESQTIERWRKVAQQQSKPQRREIEDFELDLNAPEWEDGDLALAEQTGFINLEQEHEAEEEAPKTLIAEKPAAEIRASEKQVPEKQAPGMSLKQRIDAVKQKVGFGDDSAARKNLAASAPAPKLSAQPAAPLPMVTSRPMNLQPVAESSRRFDEEALPQLPVRAVRPDPKLPVEEDLKRRFGGNIKSALGPGTVVEGKFKFDSPVRVDGTLSGEVQSTSVLIVGEQATVDGDINVGSLIVLGQVTGKINATDLVEIRGTGRLEANIRTERIMIEDGGYFEGNCNSPAKNAS